MNGSQKHELEQIARSAMRTYGLDPDFPAATLAQLQGPTPALPPDLRDLRSLPWSSIDNDESRDLDQIEVCIADPAPVRVLVGVADVDRLVPKGSPLDAHANQNTTSVYTPAIVFPMLPPELSTDRTSLNQEQDRAAIVVDMTIDESGTVTALSVYAALVRNHAQLTYSGVAAWLGGSGSLAGAANARVGGSQGLRPSDLEAQLRLQDQIAQRLHKQRDAEGALTFARAELQPIVDDSGVRELRTEASNRATDIIENFMISANGAVIRFLNSKGFTTLRRVVQSPQRWDRIVDLAAQSGGALPAQADARALQQFLKARRAADPERFPDLSLAVIKLLGRGEYVADAPGQTTAHFALAVEGYTHSTAPNRRYPDLINQRLLKAALANQPSPYGLDALSAIAQHSTTQEGAANKVERLTRKAAAALWLANRIGEQFDAIVTGAGPQGTWVRLLGKPVEGRLDSGADHLDVGDHARVKLIHTDPRRGYIDFVAV
ncbi:MAG TPA: RNB domain-containing ribonuclease [Vicinamibacterales bacterium]